MATKVRARGATLFRSQERGSTMKSRATTMRKWQVAVGVAVCAVGMGFAQAGPINLVPGSINMFRDSRTINDVGESSGERFQYGANIQGGSLGTSLSATYPPNGFTDAQVPCAPLAVNANF